MSVYDMFKSGYDFLDWFSGASEERAIREANEREYKNAWEMYERQRSDALSDRAFENQYNSPANIMLRYKQAGLNPNLIYGNSYTPGANTRSSSAQGAPKTRTEYSEPRVNELMGAINTAGSLATMGSNLATQKTVRAGNIARTALDGANTVKALADAARTDQQRNQADQLFGEVMNQARYGNEKTLAEIRAIDSGVEQKNRALDQEDQKIMQNSRKLDQADIKLAIDREKTQIYRAKTAQDIKKSQEDILKSIVYRQTNDDVRKLMAAQISSAESKASIDSITASYTSRILDAQLSKNDAEVARLYAQMTNDILKSIPALGWLVH